MLSENPFLLLITENISKEGDKSSDNDLNTNLKPGPWWLETNTGEINHKRGEGTVYYY